jgi:hypothetical protein
VFVPKKTPGGSNHLASCYSNGLVGGDKFYKGDEKKKSTFPIFFLLFVIIFPGLGSSHATSLAPQGAGKGKKRRDFTAVRILKLFSENSLSNIFCWRAALWLVQTHSEARQQKRAAHIFFRKKNTARKEKGKRTKNEEREEK